MFIFLMSLRKKICRDTPLSRLLYVSKIDGKDRCLATGNSCPYLILDQKNWNSAPKRYCVKYDDSECGRNKREEVC